MRHAWAMWFTEPSFRKIFTATAFRHDEKELTSVLSQSHSSSCDFIGSIFRLSSTHMSRTACLAYSPFVFFSLSSPHAEGLQSSAAHTRSPFFEEKVSFDAIFIFNLFSCCTTTHSCSLTFPPTVKEEIFVGEKFRFFFHSQPVVWKLYSCFWIFRDTPVQIVRDKKISCWFYFRTIFKST